MLLLISVNALTYRINFDAMIKSGSAPSSSRATPVNICCAVTCCPVGNSSISLCILNRSQSSEIASSLPLAIRIKRLHSGGFSFPLSQFLTIITPLKQSSAVSSIVNPHSNSQKCSFCAFFESLLYKPLFIKGFKFRLYTRDH